MDSKGARIQASTVSWRLRRPHLVGGDDLGGPASIRLHVNAAATRRRVFVFFSALCEAFLLGLFAV
jgi:hypothetical protein